MGVTGEISVSLNGNHTEITKYESEKDTNFKMVSEWIAVTIEDVLNVPDSGIHNP